MITVDQLYNVLDGAFPRTLSAPWDNDGAMVVPDGKRPVRRVLLTLDVIDEAAEAAIEGGCDLILSHHPLIFHPLTALNGSDPVSRRVIRLLSAGVAVFSFHTRFDAAEGGVNDALAAAVGIVRCVPWGLGRMGETESPLAPDAFAARVKEALGCPSVAYVPGTSPVSRVALLGGDGKEEIPAFLESDADAYLTGTLSYNLLCDLKATGRTVIAAGHYYTEQPCLTALENRVKEADPAIETRLFACEPIRYL